MPIRHLAAVLLSILFVAASPAFAQEAVVQTAAPIFLLPDTARVPLRTAAPNTRLRVIEEGPEGWVKVEFQDPQFGPRIGYIQTGHVTIRRPELEPMDLSIRRQEPPTETTPPAPVPPTQATTLRRHTREGAWFNIGLGLGSVGCDGCDIRRNGLSGGLSVGAAITDRFMLGVGTTGYSRTFDDELLTVGTLDGRIRFYFTRSGGGHLNFGVGLGTLSYAGETEVGLGMMLGLGWDIRIGRNVSITPFWNGFAMSNSTVDANVGQLGIGFTWH
jgi:hypothetical protein